MTPTVPPKPCRGKPKASTTSKPSPNPNSPTKPNNPSKKFPNFPKISTLNHIKTNRWSYKNPKYPPDQPKPIVPKDPRQYPTLNLCSYRKNPGKIVKNSPFRTPVGTHSSKIWSVTATRERLRTTGQRTNPSNRGESVETVENSRGTVVPTAFGLTWGTGPYKVPWPLCCLTSSLPGLGHFAACRWYCPCKKHKRVGTCYCPSSMTFTGGFGFLWGAWS